MLGIWKLFELGRKIVENNQIFCGFHCIIQISEKISLGHDKTCLPKQKNSFFLNSFFYLRFPATIYLFKVRNRCSRNGCEICSKLIITATSFRLIGCFLLLTLKIFQLLLSLNKLIIARLLLEDDLWRFRKWTQKVQNSLCKIAGLKFITIVSFLVYMYTQIP